MNKWQKAEEASASRRELEKKGDQLAALVRLHRIVDDLRPVLATLADVEDMPPYQRVFCFSLEAAIYLYDKKLGPDWPRKLPTGKPTK